MTAIRTLDNTPINHGLDFERAHAILARKAGERFAAYVAARRANNPDAEARGIAYDEAQAALKALRPNDSARIADVLRGG